MGFQTEFNWVLKLKPEQGLDETNLRVDQTYSFSKEGYRIYPIQLPINLVNQNWEAVANIIVLSFTNKDGKTEGTYKVIKIYEGKEKEMLTNYLRENVQIMKGEIISDFSKVKVS